MNLNEFLEGIKSKERCPDCDFKSKLEIEPALIPPPTEIVGIVISRDPTVRWMHFYKYIENEPQEDIRRKMLFASAIPLALINRILEFGEITEDGCLFDMVFQNVYWTHLHKCFTDPNGKGPIKSKKINLQLCANFWLDEELGYAIGKKTKFIIALGKDVEKWFNKRENKWKDRVQIIYLPHPSGRNRKWNNKDDKNIKKTIRDLFKLCRTVT